MSCPECKQPLENTAAICDKCRAQLAPKRVVSAYEVLQPSVKTRPSLELVLAVLSIPAAVMPLLGFALSVPALLLARQRKSTAPAILAMVGIVLSLAVLIFNVVYYARYAK